MDTERVEGLWQTVTKVAVAMKKEGLDTGDAVTKLRDSKVLLNHCIYDEHAHGDELAEAEMEIEEIERYLISILVKAGREEDFSFEIPPGTGETKAMKSAAIPSKLPNKKSWARVRIPKEMDIGEITNIEGVEIIEKDDETVTLAGDRGSLKKALSEISKVYSK
jgi:hypothetical protein